MARNESEAHAALDRWAAKDQRCGGDRRRGSVSVWTVIIVTLVLWTGAAALVVAVAKGWLS